MDVSALSPSPARSGRVGSWTLTTSREHEAPRRGVGADDLRRTLAHLAERGDHDVLVCYEPDGLCYRVNLAGAAPSYEAGA